MSGNRIERRAFERAVRSLKDGGKIPAGVMAKLDMVAFSKWARTVDSGSYRVGADGHVERLS